MAPPLRSLRLVRTLVLVSCLIPLVQACGRSDPQDYLFGADGSITTGARTGTAGGSPTAGGTRATNGGASASGGLSGVSGSRPMSTGGSTSTGGGGPGGNPSTGGVSSMGGIGVAGNGAAGNGVAGTGIAGAAGASPVTSIVCGAQMCDADTQRCCAGLSGLSCIEEGQACPGAVLGCTVEADCAGSGVCCISVTGDIAEASSCKSSCDSVGTGRDRQLCQADDECTAPFRYCTPTIFGFNFCTRRP